ncbi:TonB-dependent receptor [Aliikangiella sp. IMCC44653]
MHTKYLLSAFGYGIIGLLLGIYMAASHNHAQLVTHAHIMLLGFVVGFIYSLCFKIYLTSNSQKTATIQYNLHQVGTLILVTCLFLMYGNYVAANILGPVMGLASILILASMIIMKMMLIKENKSTNNQ